jgi:hypothetical protein
MARVNNSAQNATAHWGDLLTPTITPITRAVARALIGGGRCCSYIRVMPDEFLLKSVVFKLISKDISRAEYEYMNIHPQLAL